MHPALAFLLVVQAAPLSDLEQRYAEYTRQGAYNPGKLKDVNDAVFKLIESDGLKTADEFIRASTIISDFRLRMTVSRVKHELCLAALAGGNEKARTEIAKTWDGLVLASGRQQRIGTVKQPDERYIVAAAPKSIRAVFQSPDKALARARVVASNQEITKICADDQAVREGDWSKMTSKQIEAMAKGDVKRKAQTIRLLKEGKIVTAEDFDHASLVLQHGSNWNDYSLAHELSICSLLLGRREAAWLAAATYDRMLVSAGYPQRFGTQYSSDAGMAFKIDPYDLAATSDVIRKAMHCPTIQEAINRKWD